VENSFSIVIPFGKHPPLLTRAVKSILSQTYENWELIIVNDGSPEEVVREVVPEDPRIHIYTQPHLNRCFARNLGMAKAKNDWICWLDSDDAYINTYLEICNQSINEFPEYKLFNFGSIVFRAKGARGSEQFSDTTIREPFEHEDHIEFHSGRIATGSFFFHRSLYEELGGLPEVTSPYSLADEAKKLFPSLLLLYGPLYLEGGKELGNPWGDDYFLYYKFTRKYKHKVLPFYLYIQYAHL